MISGLLAAPAWAKPEIYSIDEIEQAGKEFLVSHLDWDPSRLEIKVRYEGKPLRLPTGNRSLDCKMQGGRKRVGRIQFMCYAKVNGHIMKRLRLNGEINLAYDLFRTTRTLKRGTIIQPADVEWVRVSATHVMRNIVSNENELIGHRLIRGLGDGENILTHMLQKVPLVKNGDRILIIAQKGSLRVTAPGVVKQSGFKDDTVRVENMQSRKIVLGRVIDSRTVQINF